MVTYNLKTTSYVSGNNRAEAVYSPETLSLEVRCGGVEWIWKPGSTTIRLSNGKIVCFEKAKCESSLFTNGVTDGVRAAYSGFCDEDGIPYDFSAVTFVGFDRTDGTLRAEIVIINDKLGEISRVFWPSPFAYDLPENQGYSVLPFKFGILVPSRWPHSIFDFRDDGYRRGGLYTNHTYMPFYGQTNGERGYMAILDTPFDASLDYLHTPGGATEPEVSWLPSLGHIGKRVMLYSFYAECDYVTFCKTYREYVKTRGNFKTLKQKIDENPNIEYLLGAPVLHTGIAQHIHEKSEYYDRNDPSKNDSYVTFASRGEQLKTLKARGLEKAYLHLDGWGFHGYDNLHPSPLPPHEEAGGIDGMRALSDTCAKLGYKFGIHDQYRDYYHDGADYTPENAVVDINGNLPYEELWAGGPQNLLCATLAPRFVKRNYDEFERLGIRIDGSYLDVFSVADLDECFNPMHPMTRQQCAKYRMEALCELGFRGIIPSSEEVVDSVLPAIALCHQVSFATLDSGEPAGIPVPLFNLVYHDCVVVPCLEINNTGLNSGQTGFLWALLTGNAVYQRIDANAEQIDRLRVVRELHKRLAHCEMVSHTFTDGNYRRHRAVYSDGTVIDADMDAGTYTIIYQ